MRVVDLRLGTGITHEKLISSTCMNAQMVSSDFLAPRHCFREPIGEIFKAAALLDRATGAHLAGDRSAAAELILAADIPAIRTWTDSLWGSRNNHPDQPQFLRIREVDSAPPVLPKEARTPVRMPKLGEQAALIERYGYNCVFCGIPLIRPEVRKAFTAAYPGPMYWGTATSAAHAAFQCMWMQFDHVLPHARGGDNDLDNLVVTCAGCNFGRMSHTLEEVGLIDPRTRLIGKTSWDGLERFLRGSTD